MDDLRVAGVVVVFRLALAGLGALGAGDPEVGGTRVEDHLGGGWLGGWVDGWGSGVVGGWVGGRTYVKGLALGAHGDLPEVLGVGDVGNDDVPFPRLPVGGGAQGPVCTW